MGKFQKIINFIKNSNVYNINLLIFFTISLAGCDPAVMWKFKVKNDTGYELVAKYSTLENSDTLVVLPPDSVTEVYSYFTIGQLHDLSQERFNKYFKSIAISKGDSIVYTQTPSDKTKWIFSEDPKKFLTVKSGVATYTLPLTKDDLKD